MRSNLWDVLNLCGCSPQILSCSLCVHLCHDNQLYFTLTKLSQTMLQHMDRLNMAATDATVTSGKYSKTTDSIDTICTICHEDEKIFAVAPCNHHICYKCSTRLRLLHRQFDCPICRAECPKVSAFAKLLQYFYSVVVINYYCLIQKMQTNLQNICSTYPLRFDCRCERFCALGVW